MRPVAMVGRWLVEGSPFLPVLHSFNLPFISIPYPRNILIRILDMMRRYSASWSFLSTTSELCLKVLALWR